MGGEFSCPGSNIAGAAGAGNALLGAFGLQDVAALSGKDGPTKKAEDDLEEARGNFEDIQSKWAEILLSKKFTITSDQIAYVQNTIEFSKIQSDSMDEKLFETTTRNSLLIGMLIVLVIFLILFDIL